MHIALGVVNGSPLSLLNVAGRNVLADGQSTPALRGEAIRPAPYSPASKYVREYQPTSGSIYGTNISERCPWYKTERGPVRSRQRAVEMTGPTRGSRRTWNIQLPHFTSLPST